MSEIIRLEKVEKYYLAQKRGLIDTVIKVPKIFVKALDGVSISITKGSVVAVVGESGSGKTTLGKIITTLERPTKGEVFFEDIKVEKKNYFEIRKKLDMVFQNPGTSLNPKMKVKDIVSEPLGHFDEKRVSDVISEVGLSYNEVKNKQPREMSGGQVQRVAIAKSLMKQPELLILDEPTSALDESIQAQVLNLLVDIQEKFKLTYIFITHNILVAKYISDLITVLYAGKIFEYGRTEEVLSKPLHPYTQLLLSSVPTTDTKEVKPPVGDVPSLINLPSGCSFHPRCPFVMEVCKTKEPPLRNYGNNQVACWLYE
ncbi:ABC transporter ATP-binding protein [Oxyplasma meridianum]|uniref:ABC transporter ATP-binding protein n=1 Tax=Oxyplasma meridianum TaxID=3073602 RepID=A0AAX4NFW3_9ARCH